MRTKRTKGKRGSLGSLRGGMPDLPSHRPLHSTTKQIPHELEPQQPILECKRPTGFPSRIRLVGQDWTIRYSSNLLASRGLYGFCHNTQRTIVVDASVPTDAMGETLLHEIMHALMHLSELNVELDSDLEEKAVRAWAPKLYAMLREVKPWWH